MICIKRIIFVALTLALVVCALAVPAFATWEDSDIVVIDYLDYADADHLYVVDGAKYVQITIPVDDALTVFVSDTGVVDFEYGRSNSVFLDTPNYSSAFTVFVSPINDYSGYSTTPRVTGGYLIDRSKFISGTVCYFNWTMYIKNASYVVNTNTKFSQYCHYYGVADKNGYSYSVGRTALYELASKPDFNKTYQTFQTIYYNDTSDTVGNYSNYIAPMLKIADIDVTKKNTSFTIGLNDLVVLVPINEELLELAQSQQNNKLLTELNRQLSEQGKTMQDVLKEQELTNDKLDGVQDSINDTNDKLDGIQDSINDTNDKLDGVHGAIDDTNDKLDDITDYKPEVETPEGGEIVGDLEDVEENLMEDVNQGFDQAEDIQLSIFEILAQYVTAFGAVSFIFDLFAFMPFIRALLTISLGLGIVSVLLNIGLSVSSGAERASRSAKNSANRKRGK